MLKIMEQPGLGVGTIMTTLALLTGTPVHPLPILYILSSARWVYGTDRYLDNKTEDTPEALAGALLLANLILWYKDLTPFIAPEILCVLAYPEFKRQFPILKPFYVGLFWSGAITIVPHLIANVDIDYEQTQAIAMLASGVSNTADIEDVDDDVENGIYTIPSRYGIQATRAISAGLFIGSAYKSGIIPHAIPQMRHKMNKVITPRVYHRSLVFR